MKVKRTDESYRFTNVELRRELPRQSVAEHEVFMSFVNDADAIQFHEWWNEIGAIRFGKWIEMNKDEPE